MPAVVEAPPPPYWKYPVTSTRTFTLPCELYTDRSVVFCDNPTIAPLASAEKDGSKLISETPGRVCPDGQTASQLGSVGLTTVTLMVTALAVDGTPQLPRIWKSRCVLPSNAGPPFVEVAPRVSTT